MSDIPENALKLAGQRFLYNIDLIEKKFAKKRPCGLELDIDTGEIVQVISKKQRKLTPSEIRAELKKSFLAPAKRFGNSLISSPFIDSMTTASRKTKIRVQQHNKVFERQLNEGIDHSSLLFTNEEDEEIGEEVEENSSGDEEDESEEEGDENSSGEEGEEDSVNEESEEDSDGICEVKTGYNLNETADDIEESEDEN